MTDDTREDILAKLEAGELTAEEATARLNALDAAPPPEAAPVYAADDDLPDFDPPDVNWRASLAVFGALLAITGARLQRQPEDCGAGCVAARLLLRLLFALSAVGVVLSLLSRKARWLVVRVEEADGQRINISLPIPLPLLNWALRMVRPWMEGEEAAQMDAVLAFLQAFHDEMEKPDGAPLMVDVNEDGQRVRVYIL